MTMNLLEETLEFLKEHGKTGFDVLWVGHRAMDARDTVIPAGTWEEFAALAAFEYDDGLGDININKELVIVGDDWWLEREEYDGAEWWEFRKLPLRPADAAPLSQAALKYPDLDSDP